MRISSKMIFLITTAITLWVAAAPAQADSRGDELARWLDQRGREVWGEPPEKCDDLTFARRVFLDVLGRVPSVSELRDFEQMGDDRRRHLVEMLVFAEGDHGQRYTRLSADHLARQWRQVLLPAGTTTAQSPQGVEAWLAEQFRSETPYDEIMRRLVRVQDSASDATASSSDVATPYYQLLGSLPENYAGNVSRVMLGVRLDCAQCHDHPFTDWKQEDFWGLAAFYSDLSRGIVDETTSRSAPEPGKIEFEGRIYDAKLLWSTEPLARSRTALRSRLGEWMTSAENRNFAANAVNRFWQHLIGRGIYADVENLDQAATDQRQFADELGAKFASDGYQIRRLIAAICKSDWYQAVSQEALIGSTGFYRPLKSVSPEQVFDSLEQSLHLPISRHDPSAPRWSGGRLQLISRLSESSGRAPEDYAAGIPQALMMMNGPLTADAISLETSRLLRAVVESPFFDTSDQVETLYLAVLTRRPTAVEAESIAGFLQSKSDDAARQAAMADLLWALLNSPEFVLCR